MDTGHLRLIEELGLNVEVAKGEMFWVDSNGDFLCTEGEECGFELGLARQPARLVLEKTSLADAARRS